MTSSRNNPSGPSPSWLRRERCQIYLVAALLAVIGIGLIATSIALEDSLGRRWSKGLSEGGIAAVIAGLLMAGAERYLKESLFAEIEAKFSQTLDSFATTAFDLQQFGRLPVPLRERLRARVLSAPVIQRDVSYRYDLSRVEAGDEDPYYKASVRSQSRYVNLTTSVQHFVVKEALPNPAKALTEGRKDYGFHRVTSELKGGGDFPRELLPQAIANCISTKAGSTLFTREAGLDPDGELSVSFEAVAYLDSDETISLEAFLPTINMTCTTVGGGLAFSGQAGDALSDIWGMTLGEDEENRWELLGAILPGQGFDLWFEEAEQENELSHG